MKIGSPVVKGSPLVTVSEWANDCPFVLEENRKKGKWLPKVKLRLILCNESVFGLKMKI